MNYLKYIIINQCGGSVFPQIRYDVVLNKNPGNSYFYLTTSLVTPVSLQKTEDEILKLYNLLKIKVPQKLQSLNFIRESTYETLFGNNCPFNDYNNINQSLTINGQTFSINYLIDLINKKNSGDITIIQVDVE